MAFTINYPENNLLLQLLYILLAIILLPFAIFFSLIRIPFANRRIKRLSGVLQDNWLPRKKYVYIGFNHNSPLTDFIEGRIFTHYAENIVWDVWGEDDNEWKSSEPEDFDRVTTFWQDIGGDFDGDPQVIIATYSPDDFAISLRKNFHQFMLDTDSSSITYGGEEILEADAEKKIETIVSQAISRFAK